MVECQLLVGYLSPVRVEIHFWPVLNRQKSDLTLKYSLQLQLMIRSPISMYENATNVVICLKPLLSAFNNKYESHSLILLDASSD